MGDYIPFVNNDGDVEQLRKFYSDAKIVRVLLPSLKPGSALRQRLQMHLWIDPGLDGYHCLLTKRKVFDSWETYIKQFNENRILADRNSMGSPPRAKIQDFVFSVLGNFGNCSAPTPLGVWSTFEQPNITPLKISARQRMSLGFMAAACGMAQGYIPNKNIRNEFVPPYSCQVSKSAERRRQ